MSDAQLVVYNDAGIEQVSLGGINLALVDKRTLVIGNWSTVSGPRSTGIFYQFAVNAVTPVIAIATNVSGQNGAVYAQVTKGSGSSWTVMLFGGANTPSITTAGAVTLNATVTVYTFDRAPAPTNGPGLVLYAADGTCIFNASYPTARIRQMVGTTGNPYGFPTSISVPSGKTYACIQRSAFGEMFVESFNNITGDKLVFDWRCGTSGGLSGAAIQMGSGLAAMYTAGGGISTRAGVSAVGQLWLTHGCKSGNTYYSDAMVVDVTGL